MAQKIPPDGRSAAALDRSWTERPAYLLVPHGDGDKPAEEGNGALDRGHSGNNGTGDDQKEREIKSIEETMAQNTTEILQCREQEENLEREVENMRRRTQRDMNIIDMEREGLLLTQKIQKESQIEDL
ncbi:hypothetical protein MHYP_G00081530 [Metynnis hypsauchen]